jgi:hypothetical protein
MTHDAAPLTCPTCGTRTDIRTHRLHRWYGWGLGVEYKSSISIGSLPLVHVASGFDPVTMKPRVARGVIAIGNVAVGVLAIGGVSAGVVSIGAVSVGLLTAVGAVAIGLGLSIGAVALGSVAIGAVTAGLLSSIGAVSR